jgi:cystathionine beta-lyase family protein involved in aluminum resistance
MRAPPQAYNAVKEPSTHRLRLVQIQASLGRNKKQSPALGTLNEQRQEVKVMNKMY